MCGAIKGWSAISQNVCAQRSVKMASLGTLLMPSVVGATIMGLIYSHMTTKGVKRMKTRPSRPPVA